MRILHITPHLGGGVGTVIMDWAEKALPDYRFQHRILCLDYANEKAENAVYGKGIEIIGNMFSQIDLYDHMKSADIVLVHYWNHPMLAKLFSSPIPDCRLAFWCHKHIKYSSPEVHFPDRWIDTSPIQGYGQYIWSTGNMERFLNLKKIEHEVFNVGYVGTVDYKKMHRNWLPMCIEIMKRIPNVHFTVVGELGAGDEPFRDIFCSAQKLFTFTGKVDDVAPYLATMDVFGYPLRPDHYGTCEQALGEAMAAGVVPVVMDNQAERSIIEDADSGFLEPSENDYVNAIKYLYKREPARERMGRRARMEAKQRYSIDTMIAEWNDVFEEMMARPKKERGLL